MKRALQILTHKGMINSDPASRQAYLRQAGRQHLLPLKNKIKTDEKNKIKHTRSIRH